MMTLTPEVEAKIAEIRANIERMERELQDYARQRRELKKADWWKDGRSFEWKPEVSGDS